jgi:glucokinase
MNNKHIIGIDLGATNIRGAVVNDKDLSEIISRRIKRKGTEAQVLEDVYSLIDVLIDKNIKAIGIGVPSVVDVKLGIVYDVIHIPSWKEVHLKELLESRYKIPVFVNNDANCFALGEHYFGKGKGITDMIGLTVGTGLGAGIIINNHLYAGRNCGAGEFGMVDYLEKNYEYYASGSFFQNIYGLSGEEVFKKAKKGNEQALKLYAELGTHLGNAVKMIMYTYDTELIILGGSVALAYEFFEKAMWERISTFEFPKSIGNLQIETSALVNSGILGAAALYYDAEYFDRPEANKVR